MIIKYDYWGNGKLCNLCGFHSCTLLIIIYYVMCRSILKQTIKKRHFICRLSNTLAIFAANRFACGFHHRRLKGNRVQIPDSPAAVRFHVKHFNVHPLPLIIFRYIRKRLGRRFEMETESEYLPFIVFLCYSWDRAKRNY